MCMYFNRSRYCAAWFCIENYFSLAQQISLQTFTFAVPWYAAMAKLVDALL
jgi:hypothetical protein